MLKVAIVDALPLTWGTHAIWLEWEFQKAGIEMSSAEDCDVLFVTHPGAIRYEPMVKRILRKNKIEVNAEKRNHKPYVITGGSADPCPEMVLEIADVCAVGEAYTFVREALATIKKGGSVESLQQMFIEYPHCIERSQIKHLTRDKAKPWLLESEPEIIATPDKWIDWEMPILQHNDGVYGALGSKGCKKRCSFCATTYRQPFVANPRMDEVKTAMGILHKRGERTNIITNDVVDLPFFDELSAGGILDSESLSFSAVRRPGQLRRLIRSRPKVSRFGLEGLSERIRKSFGKPVPNSEVMSVLTAMHTAQPCVNGHLFLITGAPYETVEDLNEWKEFYLDLSSEIKAGLCRVKYTSFKPDAPAPLGRFVTGPGWHDEVYSLRKWVVQNAAGKHMLSLWGQKSKSIIKDLVEVTRVPKEVWADVFADDDTKTFDMAPDISDAKRLPWEVIDWPLSVESRWKIGSVYRKRMGGGDVLKNTALDKYAPEKQVDTRQYEYLSGQGDMIE